MKKKQKWIIIVAVLALILGGGAYAGRSYVMPAIKNWRMTKMNAEAREFLTKGDAPNALLLARKSLAMSGKNAEAWRIAVAAAKTKKTAEVIFYQDNLTRVEPTKENYLELIRQLLQFNAPSDKLIDTVKAAGKVGASDPEYHRLAVEVYERFGRAVTAKYHLISLLSLAPNDRLVQLKLAAIEMMEDKDRKDRELRARVRALADDPALRAQALSMLLREAVNAKLLVDTTELLARLKAVPDLSVDRQLLLIEASMLVAPDTVDGLLADIKAKVADTPPEAIKMMEFLRRTGAAKQAWAWYQKLPEKTRQDTFVMRSAGEALFALRDWPTLESFLRPANWGESNYMRHAFLAYAYRTLGRKADFNDAWKAAVGAAGTDYNKCVDLIIRVDSWKWEDEHYDVLWKIFALRPQDPQVRAQVLHDLIAWERRHDHTANLNKIFASIVQSDPSDAVMRNNLAYTSLLLDSNLGQAFLIADELVKTDPSNAFFATTRALSLYKQGKFQEALEQIKSLGYSARTMPERMLLEALFLAKAGDGDRATDLLDGIVVANLLPEEKKLRADALADIARSKVDRGNRNRLQALKRGAETGGWLGLLDPATQRDATVDMQLADSAYASGDFEGLTEMLKKADWGNYQYINTALSTYLRRKRDGADASRDSWRQTLVLAQKDLIDLQNLMRLVTQWGWENERIETLAKLFERNPKDRLVLAELLKYYRDNRKVANMLKALTAYLGEIGDTDVDERSDYAYYSLISNQNSTAAQVAAKKSYDLEPDNVKRSLVQAFSLWKQNRYKEAEALLKTVPQNVQVENIPRALITAAVEAETAAPQAAKTTLETFDSKLALPEEVVLADQIGQRIAAREKAGTK